MRLRIGRHIKFIVLISLFCLSFLLIPDYLSQNSPNPDISQDPITDSIPFSSVSITYPWGNDNGTAICTEINAQLKHQIISDGLGGAIMVWRDFRAGYYTIYAQRVDADGNTLWGANGTAICLASQNKDDPQLCIDGKGGAFIAWEDWRDSNFNIYVQYINSTGNTQWTTDGVRIVSDSASQINPQVASDGQGGVYVTWEDYRASNYDIYAQRLNATGHTLWTTDGIGVITDTNSQTGHELIADGFNNTIFVWEDDRNGNSDVYAQKLDLNGNDVWTTDGVAVCDYSFNQFYDKLAPDGAGGAIFVWNDYRASNYDIYAQRINSAGLEVWTAEGVAICSATNDQIVPQITADGSGGAIISWDDSRGLDTDIYAQRVDANGVTQWTSQGVVVCNTTGVQDESVIVNVDNGSTIIAWTDNRAGTDDIYAQYVTSAGTTLWEANGSAVCTALSNQYTPQIASNTAKSAIIIWRDARSDTGDIYCQRVHQVEPPLYYIIQDNGTAICTEIEIQFEPQIVIDGSGGAIIAWRDNRSGNYDIYVQRITSAGDPLWGVNGTPVCATTGDQDNFALISDGSGGAILTWDDDRTGTHDIYAQKISPSGEPEWTLNGVAICTASGNQYSPVITTDQFGGGIICWVDGSIAFDNNLYIQRVNATGHTLWTGNGVAICTQGGHQMYQELIPDGLGGAIIAWMDNRPGTTDVYAQRINATGAIQWLADGIVICDAPFNQDHVTICTDETNGAIITWRDDRKNGDQDVFAQRINSTGDIQWALNGVVVCNATNYQGEPAIVSTGGGWSIITWQDRRGGLVNHLYTQKVDGNGQRQWSLQGVPLSTADTAHSAPETASDGNGGAIITWYDYRNSNYDVFAEYVNSTGQTQWGQNGIPICNSQNTQNYPTICSDGIGGAFITWQDSRTGIADIWAQHINSRDKLGPSAPIISSSTHPNQNTVYIWPAVTVQWTEPSDPAGLSNYLYIYDQNPDTVPTSGDFSTISTSASFTLSDGTWYFHVCANDTLGNLGRTGHFKLMIDAWPADGVPIYTDFLEEQDHPQITPDGTGGAIISWHANTGDTHVWAQRIAASGQYMWEPNGTIICDAIRSQGPTAICSDGAGGAIIVWADYRDLNYDIYAQRINSTGQVQWTTNGIAICDATGGQEWPEIASDGAGGAYIVWEDNRGGNYDIYAQHINSSGDPQWTTNGIVICNASGLQNRAELILSGTSGIIITWEDLRDGGEDIYAQRIEAGTPMWGFNGIPICTVANNQRLPLIVPDGEDGGIIMWEDERTDGGDIYAQRVNVSGVTQWAPNGTVICVESGDQSQPRIASDENGGAIIVWADNRVNWDIYAQKINSSGQVQWAANGVAICNYDDSQTGPGIASDGVGGAIIAWSDWRSMFDADMYAQHVNAIGQSLLAANGTLICGAAESQYFPQCQSMEAVAPYQAIMVWNDMRNGMQTDIYAQRVIGVDQEGPAAPILSSPSHPDENFGYSSPYPSFEWTAYDPSGITNYLYMWDKNPLWVPTELDYVTTNTFVNLSDVPDGTWYFHVRANDTLGNLGATAHLKFMIDSNCAISLTNYTLESSLNQSYTAVLADFDLDGDLDLATSDNNSAIYLWQNPYNYSAGIDPFSDIGSWTKTLVGTTNGIVKQLKVADLNNDGTPDLISSHSFAATAILIIWKNNGTPWMQNWYANGIHSEIINSIPAFDVGDIHHDGDIDVIFALTTTNQIRIRCNPYKEGYDPFNTSWILDEVGSGGTPTDLKLTDLNRDGLLDVVYTAGPTIRVIQNNLTSWINVGTIITDSSNFVSLQVTDLDHNGSIDLIAGTTNQEIVAYCHNGSPFTAGWHKTMVGNVSLVGSYLPRALTLGDLDNNGYLDIIVAFSQDPGGTYLYVYKNNKRPFLDDWANIIQGIYEPTCFKIALGDLDHDGDLDAAFGCCNFYLARNVHERLNSIPVFSDRIQLFSSSYLLRVEFGDLDNDGDLDVIGRFNNDPVVYGWRNNGDPFGTWTQFTIKSISGSGNFFSAKLVDLDNDGWLDIAAGYGVQAHVLRNDHTPWNGQWDNYQFAASTFYGYNEIGVADFDHDGNVDIACTSTMNGLGVFIWKNNGTPFRTNWDQYKIGSSIGGVEMRYLRVADFDNDGWDDLVSADYGGYVYFWRNNHTPFISNWPTYVTQSIGGTNRLCTADLDFDGDPDVCAYSTDATMNTKVLECDETPFSGSWSYNTIFSYAQSSYNGIASGDVDSDGWLDVIVMDSFWLGGGQSRPEVQVLVNNHTPFHDSWDNYALQSSTNNLFVQDIQLYDIDWDGDLDVLAATTGAGGAGLYCWKNLADQDFSGPSAPVINSSTHPNPISWYNPLNVSLQWTAHDPSGITNYLYCYDQNSSTIPTPTDQITSYTSTNITIPFDGVWYFHVRGNDTFGNLGDTGHFIMQLDNSPPQASNPRPLNGSYTNDSSPSVYLDINDTLSGVGMVQFFVNSSIMPSNWNGTTVSWIGSGYPSETLFNIQVNAFDVAGNSMTPYQWSFYIDLTPPFVTETLPENNSYTSNPMPNIIAYIDDAMVGLNSSSVEMRINNSLVSSNVTYTILSSLGLLEVASSETFDSYAPDIAIDSEGNIHLVWYNSAPSIEIFYRCWNATTHAWTAREEITTDSTDDAYSPAIAVDANGNVHVAWEDDSDGWWGTDTTIFYKFRNASTGTWSGHINATDIITPLNYSYSCDIAVDHAGQAHIVWYDQAWSAIYYRSWNASSGNWGAIEEVSSESTAVSLGATIATDSAGQPHVVWYDSTNIDEVDANAYDIFYKYRNLTTGTWTSVEVISLGSVESARYPDIAIDPEDNVHVVWRDQRNEPGGQIFYRQRNATTANWTSMQIVCPFAGQSSYPSVSAIDGFIHVVWQDSADYAGAGGSDYDIFHRVLEISSSVWSDIALVSTESNETTTQCWNPAVAVSNTGTAHMVWVDTKDYLGCGTDWDVFYKNLTINNLWEVAYTPPTPYSISNAVQVDIDAADLLGNVMSTYSWIFTIDLDPPIASNPYPSHESCIINADPLIFLNLEDSWSGINNATISLIVNGSPEIYSWNGTTLSWDSAGPYASGTILNLAVTVQDIAGNVMPTYSWWFRIDYDPPTASNPAPGNNTYTSDGTPDITVILDDPGAGLDLDTIEMRINTSLVTSILSPIVGPLGELQVVSNDSSQSYYPEIAVDSSGNLHVVWYDNAGGWDNIFYRCWNATTGSWTTAEQITTQTNGNARNPKVAVDPDGNVHVVYEDDTDGWWGTYWNIFYKLRNASTGVWSGYINTTDVISFETIYNSIYCEIAVDTFNQAHIVWYQDYNVYYKRWNVSSNNWDAAELVSSGCSGTSSQPAIAVDSTGRPHVVWQDNTNLGESDSDAYDVFYKYKNIATGNWAALQYISLGSYEPAWDADIAIDSADHVHVVWKDERDDPDGYIYYRRRNATTSSWTSMEIVCSLPGISEVPKVAEGNGIVHVVWYDRSDYLGAGLNDYDIFYRGLDVARNAWSDIALISVESNVSSNSWYPAIAADNTGVAHIVWMDPTNTIGAGSDNDIFYREVSLGSSWMVSWTPGASYPSSLILVEVEATDLLGNTMGTYSWSFIIDRDSPVASSPYPLSGSYISNDDPTILLNLLDALSGINASTIVLSVNGSPEVHSWNGTTLSWDSAGPYASGSLLNLAVDVYDNVGNAMPTYSWWFIIDLDGPQASSPNPANNSYVSATTPTITIELVDLLSGVNSSSIILNVNSIDYRVSDPELSYIGTTLTFNPPSAYSDAQLVSLTLDSSDLLGNVMPSYTWTFIVDISQPFVLNEQPENGTYVAELQPNISLLLADSISGVNSSSINLNVEGTDYNLTNIELNYISSNLTFTPPASYANGQIINCILTASDNAGNAITPYIWYFIIDIQAPVADNETPFNNGYTWDSTPTIQVNLDDALSGINASTIVLEVGGLPVSHSWNGTTVSWTQPAPYANGAIVNCQLDASDNLGNAMVSYFWSFTIDLQSPIAGNETPVNNTYIANNIPTIQVDLIDNISGIDNSSIVLRVEGAIVTHSWDGLTVSWDAALPYTDGTVVNCQLDASDNVAQAMASYFWSFTIDLSGPQAFNPFPGGGYIADNQPSISLTLNDTLSGVNASSINLNIEGINYNITDPELNYVGTTLTFNPSTAFADGQQIDIALDASDNVGNPMFTLTWFFTIDLSEPIAGNETPIDGGYTNNPLPFISVDLVDTLSGIDNASIILTVDFTVRPHDWDGTTVSWTMDSSKSDGDTVFCQLFASDNLGNTMGGYTWSFTIDLSSPQTANPVPEDGGYTRYNQPTVNITLTDDYSGVNASAIVLTVAGTDYNITSSELSYDGTILTFTPFVPYADTYIVNLTLNALDNVGNPMSAFMWSFTVDLTPPTALNELPTNNTEEYITETPQINVTLVDWNSGINASSIVLTVNGIPVAYSFDGVNVTYTPTPLPQLVWNNITVDVSDMAGNPMPQYGWHFFINLSRPSIRDVSPINNSYVSNASPEISAFIDSPQLAIVEGTINLTVNGVQVQANYDNVTGKVWNITAVPFTHGQLVQVYLSANDTVDNICFASWSFIIDLNAPTVIGYAPVATYVNNSIPLILINITDDLAGVNGSSILMNVSGVPVSPSWDGVTVSWIPGGSLSNGDEVNVILDVKDNAGNPLPTYNFWFWIDTETPSVDVLIPVSFGIYQGGIPLNITWNVSDVSPCTVTIQYSDNNGSTWQDINAGLYSQLNDGIELWTVPSIDSSECLVRINVTDSVGFIGSNLTDNTFIIWITYPSVSILSPTSSTVINAGDPFTIQWSGSNGAGARTIDIEYSANNGTIWQPLFTLPDNGSKNWITPIIDSDQCLIRINVTDEALHTESVISNLFAIDQFDPTCILDTPMTGVTIISGDLYTIRWIANDTASSVTVRIEYTLDGTHWYDINGGSYSNVNDGAESWAVPSVSTDSDQCRLRITVTDAAGHYFEITSDFFTLKVKPPQDDTLIYIIVIAAAAAAAVISLLVIRSRRKPDISVSPERAKWISALGERIKPEMSLQDKLNLIINEEIPVEAIKDEQLIQLLNTSIGGIPIEILDQLTELLIPEDELKQILLELQNLTVEEQKEFIKELSSLHN